MEYIMLCLLIMTVGAALIYFPLTCKFVDIKKPPQIGAASLASLLLYLRYKRDKLLQFLGGEICYVGNGYVFHGGAPFFVLVYRMSHAKFAESCRCHHFITIFCNVQEAEMPTDAVFMRKTSE